MVVVVQGPKPIGGRTNSAISACGRWKVEGGRWKVRLPASRGWQVLLVGGTAREGGREDKEERRRKETRRSYVAPLKYMARSNFTSK